MNAGYQPHYPYYGNVERGTHPGFYGTPGYAGYQPQYPNYDHVNRGAYPGFHGQPGYSGYSRDYPNYDHVNRGAYPSFYGHRDRVGYDPRYPNYGNVQRGVHPGFYGLPGYTGAAPAYPPYYPPPHPAFSQAAQPPSYPVPISGQAYAAYSQPQSYPVPSMPSYGQPYPTLSQIPSYPLPSAGQMYATYDRHSYDVPYTGLDANLSLGKLAINLSQYKKGGFVFCCLTVADQGGNVLLRLCGCVDEATLAQAQALAMRALAAIHDRLHAAKAQAATSGAEAPALPAPPSPVALLSEAFDRVQSSAPRMPGPALLEQLAALPTLTPAMIPSSTQKGLAARELVRKVSALHPALGEQVRCVLTAAALVDAAYQGDPGALRACQMIAAQAPHLAQHAASLHARGAADLGRVALASVERPAQALVQVQVPAASQGRDAFGLPAVSGAEDVASMTDGVYVHAHQVLPNRAAPAGTSTGGVPERYTP